MAIEKIVCLVRVPKKRGHTRNPQGQPGHRGRGRTGPRTLIVV